MGGESVGLAEGRQFHRNLLPLVLDRTPKDTAGGVEFIRRLEAVLLVVALDPVN